MVTPLAPTLLDPIDNTPVAVDEDYTFDWDFNPADGEPDTQAQYELRHRESGTSPWTTVAATTSDTFRIIAGGTFTTDLTYEWQVRTNEDVGEPFGPWSGSEFFDAETRPAAPTITDPVTDQTVGPEHTVEWTTATQTAYQVRVVADDGAGSPDETTVVEDTGPQESSVTRSQSMPFATDDVTQHVQVRTRHDGLWSDWATVRVDVDYTEPATPTISLLEGSPPSAITIDADHPAPSGTEPTVDSMDVQRRESPDGEWVTIATGLDPTDTYVDWTPADGTLYDYRIVARASSNGTSATSAVGTGSVTLHGVWIHDPADGAGTILHLPANDEGGADTSELEVGHNRYAGREHPVAEYGEHTDDTVDVTTHLRSDLGEEDALRTLIRRRTVLLYRDGSGRRVFGTVAGLQVQSTFYGGIGRWQVRRVDHDEAV